MVEAGGYRDREGSASPKGGNRQLGQEGVCACRRAGGILLWAPGEEVWGDWGEGAASHHGRARGGA